VYVSIQYQYLFLKIFKYQYWHIVNPLHQAAIGLRKPCRCMYY